MSALIPVLLMMAVTAPATLEQVRAEPSLERRGRLAVDFATAAEREAESAYGLGEMEKTQLALRATLEAVELARLSLEQSGRSPGRNPGPYKYVELRTRDLLQRLDDLEQRMDSEERPMIEKPRARIREIHEAWLEGLMGKKK